ncbi:hypothetical protein HYALB_00012849 [Hymenoscyphus albidus]|uniref:Xylanolytic transcriptional activator regulatory domain-containing protein n=1 Tax=Hymenoscyphus albidus TaxID=595503 RepID=A0A9N9Q712_9HELO|nr:hypothetical protein HYALB_00012849 [Hymenoscyphus albidus]
MSAATATPVEPSPQQLRATNGCICCSVLNVKNLDAAEQRCEKLEALLKSLNPELDLESLLKNGLPSASPPPVNQLSPRSPQQIDQASPGSTQEYEWHEAPLSTDHEQIHSFKDGMALLSTDPSSSGYLGSSAGSSMLQTIFSLLSLRDSGDPLEDSSNRENQSMVPKKYSESGVLLLEGDLTSSIMTEGLIDAYFLLYNTSYPVLHSQLFREQYANRSQIPNTSSWQLILYTVLAIGHWVLSTGDDNADSPYYLAARSRMDAGMLESGTLAGVQAFLLMGNYLQKRDRPNTGYNMIGIAYRMALGLGLHREIPNVEDEANTLNREIRRRVWWILYMVDSGFSITMGRPTTASDAFIDAKWPENVDDSHLTSDELSLSLSPPVDYPTTYSAMIAQARLSVIANKIYNQFLAAHIGNVTMSEDLAQRFEEELRQWKQSLAAYFFTKDAPTWFLGPRAVLLWKEQNLRMILWRGGQRSYKTRSRSEIAVQNCLHVAIETAQSICSFCSCIGGLHHGLSWYAIYFLFQAVLVLDVGLLQAPEDALSSTWRSAIDEARKCLSQLGSMNAAALRCISVLSRIHNHHRAIASTNHLSNAVSDPSLLLPFADPNGTTQQSDSMMHQTYIADPALQFFLDGTPMTNLLEGVSGFPSTQEHQNFDYIPGDFYGVEELDPTINWHSTQF